MGFLVLAVTMRFWAHMGLRTFAPFYYMNVLKVIALMLVVGLIPILLMRNPERKTAREATAQ